MSTTKTLTAVSSHLFTPDEQDALRLLWEIYERHYDEILAVTMAAAEADPSLKKILAQVPAAQLEADQARSKRLTEAAMRDGDWDPMLNDTTESGRNYARMGLPFPSWFPIVTAFQKPLIAKLFQAYESDPVRLQAILHAMNKWLFDVTLASIGEMYLETREQVIKQQQEAIKELSTPVLPLRAGLLLLPVIGVIDSQRARQLTEQLLDGIRTHRAKAIVIDLTGVPAVD